MTPQQKIRHLILIQLAEWDGKTLPEVTAENVDELYDAEDSPGDAVYELREGQVETKVPCESSRHLESKSVAAQAPDGTWVGWTYWYGGGKHAEPESIDWIEDAYDLVCAEEEKLVTVRTFSKAA